MLSIRFKEHRKLRTIGVDWEDHGRRTDQSLYDDQWQKSVLSSTLQDHRKNVRIHGKYDAWRWGWRHVDNYTWRSSQCNGKNATITRVSVSTDDSHSMKISFHFLLRRPRYYEPGYEYTTVVPGRDVGTPRYAMLEWEYKANPLNPLTWRILSTPRVYVEYITIESLEHRST